MDFDKLGRNEVLIYAYMCSCFATRSAQERIHGGAKIGHGCPLLQETSSSDRKDTATTQMRSNDEEACGMKCCCFGSIPNSNFEVFLDLVIFPFFMQYP